MNTGRHRLRIASILLSGAMLLLSACAPNAREPDGLVLARVLGVDGSGPVTLTAVCGGEDGGQGAHGTALGADFMEAREKLPWTGEEELALTSLSYLIVGDGADLEAVAEAVILDHELSPGASVWYAQDAGALLAQDGDAAARLAVLEERGVKAPTAAQVLAELETNGRTQLPRLIWDGQRLETDGTFTWEKTG